MLAQLEKCHRPQLLSVCQRSSSHPFQTDSTNSSSIPADFRVQIVHGDKTHIHACIHTCIHTYIHKCTQTHMHMYPHTYIQAYIYTYIRTYIHIRTYIYIHTYIHTFIQAYIRTYIHTYSCSLKQIKYQGAMLVLIIQSYIFVANLETRPVLYKLNIYDFALHPWSHVCP